MVEGNVIAKPSEESAAALYMVNPLEPHLNVARNVQENKLLDFQQKCKTALNDLEATTHPGGSRKAVEDRWGLTGLCTPLLSRNSEESASETLVPIRIDLDSIFGDESSSESKDSSDKVTDTQGS